MLICQDFGFCQDFVSIKKEGGQEFRSLEVRRKLIALKKRILKYLPFKPTGLQGSLKEDIITLISSFPR